MKSKKQKQEEAVARASGYKGEQEPEPCCMCRYHSNSPSYCSLYVRYVGRKETCMRWTRRK